MSKDPAFLFYPNDYIGGTMGWTFEQKGAYVELLMFQFNRGHMTEEYAVRIVGDIWNSIKDKFIKDEYGLYYNVRLDLEKERRIKYSESRRNNIKGINQYTKRSYDQIMTTHMENENENIIENKVNNLSLGNKVNKKKYGEYNHILLTEQEYNRLIKDFGEQKTKEMIKNMDEAIELKGYKYKNHNLAIRKWENNRKDNNYDATKDNSKRWL